MRRSWIDHNHFELLENGEEYFPRVFEAIAQARQEVLLETFILFEDKVGQGLHAALLQAARTGARVEITLDGWGSPQLSEAYVNELAAGGVKIHIFDPTGGWLRRRANVFRRLHRKLVVVDGCRAFIGGINYSADHLGDFGPLAKQDYAVEARGPIVRQIHEFMLRALAQGQGQGRRRWYHRRQAKLAACQPSQGAVGTASALFVWRNNRDHRNDIERQYRLAMRLAQDKLIIANAYFFPGYVFLRDLRRAAKRGVRVVLILQGNPDMPIVRIAAGMLYEHLLDAGVEIYEYCDRPLHAKVAVADDEWATVGSSNLDPLSLSLNLEANVVIRDRDFNRQLSDTLEHLIANSCNKIGVSDLDGSPLWRQIRGYFLFHILRRYPSWIGWLPAHVPRLGTAAVPPQADRVQEEAKS